MGNFGEDLRMERLSRGIALEDISAVTKISQRYLLALEQEKFRLLPGGILNKGIVRSYAGALGLNQHDWTERYLKAYNASGQVTEDDRSWTAFAQNVGKARILRHDAVEVRLRWIGAILLLLVVAAAAFLSVRYYGLRAGWWTTLIPVNEVSAAFHAAWSSVHDFFGRILSWFNSQIQ
jgi:cytoskeletal protein RodZ